MQIDLTKREYSQILGNNFSNGKTFEAICKNNQAALEEDFFSKLFFLYDPEIQKISNRARRYAPEIDEKRMEIEIAKLEKKIFSKQKIESIWQREKFSYTSYVESARYEYPATLNCAFSFYFQYPGGSDEFKTHIEKYFVK